MFLFERADTVTEAKLSLYFAPVPKSPLEAKLSMHIGLSVSTPVSELSLHIGPYLPATPAARRRGGWDAPAHSRHSVQGRGD